MAQLIQMRQRIKAIETIKKITHAMRLISMSMHSRLRNRASILEAYQKEIDLMFEKVRFAAPKWNSPIMYPEAEPENNQLLIVVGSQKGLCGNFNSSLFKEFQQTYTEEKLKKIKIVAIGKHAIDRMKKQPGANIVKTFDNFSITRLNLISGRLVELIMESEIPYSSVVIFANALKTFFLQNPEQTTVLPLSRKIDESISESMPNEPYLWEQNPNEILNDLSVQYVTSKVYYLLFQSLLAEQAARFISMDNSTRNAKELLEETQRLYNKLRQAKITRELTELSASFQN